MDNQPTDPNNPLPSDGPQTPPVAEPVAPVVSLPASMWDAQPNLTPPASPMPTPVVEPQIPTFTPPMPTTPTTPNFGENPMSNPVPPAPAGPAPAGSPATAGPEDSSVPSWVAPPEAMPTDLSNLMSNPSSPVETAQPTVVVPPPGSEANQVVTSGSKGFPKIVLIIGGLIFLLIVGGVSAYFILGVGNSATLPASVPAEQQTLTTPPKQIVPTVVVPTETATISALPTQPAASGSSAINLLRSRVTPTP